MRLLLTCTNSMFNLLNYRKGQFARVGKERKTHGVESRLEAIAIRVQAITIRVQAIASNASRLEAI